jgi:DNA-binding CsgD family transcriptional regulator
MDWQRNASNIKGVWRLSLLVGASAAVFSLMFGLLLQTLFYKIASNIPGIYRQDFHITIPLCKVFPDLNGCQPWVGALTGLEISELSYQIGQISGWLFNLVMIAGLSVWFTIRKQSNQFVPGLLNGLSGVLFSLLFVLALSIPLNLDSLSGIFGILSLILLPLSGFLGDQIGKRSFTKRLLRKPISYLPTKDYAKAEFYGETLSGREVEVLSLVAQGYKNHQIAQRLFISNATVKTHLQHIYSKFGVNNRTAAVTQALAHGLLEQDDEKDISD